MISPHLRSKLLHHFRWLPGAQRVCIRGPLSRTPAKPTCPTRLGTNGLTKDLLRCSSSVVSLVKMVSKMMCAEEGPSYEEALQSYDIGSSAWGPVIATKRLCSNTRSCAARRKHRSSIGRRGVRTTDKVPRPTNGQTEHRSTGL